MIANYVNEAMLTLEHKFWNAMQDKDAARAAQMTDDGCIVVGAQGVSAIDKQTMGKMVSEAEWELQHYAVDDAKALIKMVGEDVAIVAYEVTENIVVDGQPLTLTANDASVWVRRDGQWVCALHTETPAGDPFGRVNPGR